MSVKRRARSVMRDLNRNNRRRHTGLSGLTKGHVQNTLQSNNRHAADGPPRDARTIPAMSLLRGRNTYACADDRCAGQFRISNGYSMSCNRCGRMHHLRTPTITHWTPNS